jgi:hypothetical protein
MIVNGAVSVGCKMLLLDQDIWRLKKQGGILKILLFYQK